MEAVEATDQEAFRRPFNNESNILQGSKLHRISGDLQKTSISGDPRN